MSYHVGETVYGLAEPPRRVPLSLRITHTFAGSSQRVGWILFGLGTMFFCVFASETDYSGPVFAVSHETTNGVITDVTQTNKATRRSPIYAFDFTYTVDGTRYTGTSYSTRFDGPDNRDVTVEYLASAPSLSRIEGLRRAPFGLSAALLTAVFPVVGLFVVIPGVRAGVRRARLLRRGLPVAAKLVHSSVTDAAVNSRRIFELEFAYVGRDGLRRTVVTKTSRPGAFHDDVHKPVLYDPGKPARAFLLDEVSPRIDVDIGGRLVPAPRAALMALLAPGAAFTLLAVTIAVIVVV